MSSSDRVQEIFEELSVMSFEKHTQPVGLAMADAQHEFVVG